MGQRAPEEDAVAVGQEAATVVPVAQHRNVVVKRDAEQVVPGDVPEGERAGAGEGLGDAAGESQPVGAAAHESAHVGEAAEQRSVLVERHVGSVGDVPAEEREGCNATNALRRAEEVADEPVGVEQAAVEVEVAANVHVAHQPHPGRVVGVEVVEVGGEVAGHHLQGRAGEADVVARCAIVAIKHARVQEAAQHVDILVERHRNGVVEGHIIEARHRRAAYDLRQGAVEVHQQVVVQEAAVIEPVAQQRNIPADLDCGPAHDVQMIENRLRRAGNELRGQTSEVHRVAVG